jgi:uncharacterized protein (DUF433 family)
VRTIVVCFQFLGSVDQVLDAYPALDRATFVEALAFYDAYREEIARYIAENEDDDGD